MKQVNLEIYCVIVVILKEDNLKLLIGGASSLNIGASHKVGEGHYIEEETPNGIFTPDGTFMFYNADSTLENKLTCSQLI